MTSAATGYRWEDKALVLEVRVQPRAGRVDWVGLQAGRFRVRLTAPPAAGKANAQLRQVLADIFRTSPGKIVLIAGAGSRDKRLRIDDPRRLPDGVAPPE